ncbi:hypothetical protein BD779DRAFT_1485544 [Infundibulicybe gibba]|nr:hypothetical protein BD779DRAFT_1485544 [Infundibulicybe gibba]
MERPAPEPIQPQHDTISDIYRGDPPSRPCSPDQDHISSSSSSSSSSDSFIGGGRLGAIAAVVELAISRWARGNVSSSSSSSSSSSRSSIVTLSRSQRSRRRKPGSTFGNQSERDIAACITRIKAREESRQIPRSFALYIPPSLAPRPGLPVDGQMSTDQRRIESTSSLSSILNQLDAILKRNTRTRRHHDRNRIPRPESYIPPPNRSASFPEIDTLRKTRKGKHRESNTTAGSGPIPSREQSTKAWFLDVASPTWEDMRAIGKLLHLHPLTLEDILQQDPREKLELFPKLGYYFVAFRAIESQSTKQHFVLKKNVDPDDSGGIAHDEGVIGEANVYLIVFNEGICAFHFTDVSEHLNRVRSRIILLEEVTTMSSDWIAHGILDSIVDSFFPFLEEIEKEVVAIDDIVFSGDIPHFIPPVVPQHPPTELDTVVVETMPEKADLTEFGASLSDEKYSLRAGSKHKPRTRFAPPRLNLSLFLRHTRRAVHKIWISFSSPSPSPPSTTAITLRRMARARRTVTSLARLLASKYEVVAQIRKRLLNAGQSGLGNGSSKGEDIEIAIYMGDIQDHILTLQHSLSHYERMLSESHPTYLSQLRTTVALTKSGTDKALIFLTIVSIAVLCIQTLIGSFSLNIHIPANGHGPGEPYNVLILCAYLAVVRWWWVQAKRRRGAVL